MEDGKEKVILLFYLQCFRNRASDLCNVFVVTIESLFYCVNASDITCLPIFCASREEIELTEFHLLKAQRNEE